MSKGKIEMNAPGKFSITGDQSEDNYIEINPEDLGMDWQTEDSKPSFRRP